MTPRYDDAAHSNTAEYGVLRAAVIGVATGVLTPLMVLGIGRLLWLVVAR